MERQVKQAEYLLGAIRPAVAPHQVPRHTRRINGSGNVREIGGPGSGLSPEIGVRVQVGENELNGLFLFVLSLLITRRAVPYGSLAGGYGTIQVALDGGRGTAATSAEVDKGVGVEAR